MKTQKHEKPKLLLIRPKDALAAPRRPFLVWLSPSRLMKKTPARALVATCFRSVLRCDTHGGGLGGDERKPPEAALSAGLQTSTVGEEGHYAKRQQPQNVV